MIYIEISESIQNKPDEGILLDTAKQVLHHESVPLNSSLTILLTTNEHIQQLNRQYRNVDAPTDVLSFKMDIPDPDENTQYLGDVVISLPIASEQAKKQGYPTISEVQLLIVHGILHILGYDHNNPQEKSRMWQKQREILKELGLESIAPP